MSKNTLQAVTMESNEQLDSKVLPCKTCGKMVGCHSSFSGKLVAVYCEDCRKKETR